MTRPPDRRAEWAGLTVIGLLLLGAAVRALRLAAPFHWPWHSDEVEPAIPALQILAGALPTSAGKEYFGAAPSYALAVWFGVAGTSTLALDLFAFAVGLLIFWTSWLVLRRFLDRPAALLGLAVLAVPPLFLTRWSLINANHPPNLLLGNLCLLATHTIFVADPGRRRALLALGLLAGLGWWTSPLIVVYLAPFAVLATRTGLLWQPRIGWLVGGALLGCLPQALYELSYFPSAKFTLHEAGSVQTLPFGERLTAVLGDFLPKLLGPHVRTEWPWLLAFLLVAAPLWAAALVRAAVRDRAEIAWTLGAPGRIGRGQIILWIVAAANLALVLTTRRAIDAYYLLPLYSVLPCWMGEWLDWLRRRRPVLAGAALASMLALALLANWHDSLGAKGAAAARRWAPVEGRARPLIEWLQSRGIDRVYATDLPRFSHDGMTYLARGRVVFADLWREHIVTHGRRVDAAVSPAIVTAEPALSRLRTGLQALDLAVREAQIGELRVLEPEPRFTTTFVPLPRDRWTIAASHRAEQARDLLDGDAATSWDTGEAQAPGQWLAVDLGAPELVARVDLLAIDWQNVPAGLRVEISLDGHHWDTVAAVPDYWGPLFFSEHHPFLRVRRGRVQAIFPPVRARHLRIVQTATGSRPWAARELFAYTPGGPRPPVPQPGELTAALRREGVRFVYANHWLSAWVRVDSRDAIGALDSNINVNDYSRTEPDPTALLPPRLEPGTAFLLGADADAAGVRARLAAQAVTVRESAAGPYRLLVLTPAPAPRRLDKRGWRVRTSESPDHAPRTIDGDRRTQWVSGGPGRPAPTVTLDVGFPRDLRGVEVRPGLPGRDLRLAGSLDGAAWSPIEPLAWAGSLYWTGSELLANGGPRWAVAFPPTRLRYLRLTPAAPLREPWAIAELEALE